ncbi:VOC family protein [Pseudonocardia acaciae]|uniref:VOC family protein n=1 Tax=Pseudonocardia acaciae TaxID=551276 RepID=UPI00048A8FCA|nr:VOC family protein [Pseudonocardia acaciae]
MVVHRIVPNLKVADVAAGHEFYERVLGLEKSFGMDWITGFWSPDNHTAQLSLISRDATAPEDSAVSVGTSEVDEAYARARRMGVEIVHPLTDEPWGVRRFFVRDPHGHVINVVSHRD